MDESKNELKTIVSTKIENISEYLRHLNTEPVYRDTSKLNRGFFASENRKIFPRFLLHLLKKRLDESTVYFFHRLYNLSQVGNALYITSLDKNQETLGLYDDSSSLLLVVGPSPQFLSIKIWLIPLDTIKFHKVLSPPFQTEGLHHQEFAVVYYTREENSAGANDRNSRFPSTRGRQRKNEVKKGSAAQKGGRWSAMTRCPIPSRLKP